MNEKHQTSSERKADLSNGILLVNGHPNKRTFSIPLRCPFIASFTVAKNLLQFALFISNIGVRSHSIQFQIPFQDKFKKYTNQIFGQFSPFVYCS